MRQLFKTKRFSKDISKLNKSIQIKAFEISQKLILNPFDSSLEIKQLTGYDRIYRVVVFSDFRMIYTFDKLTLTLLRIANRKDIYKNLEF